MEVLIFLVIIFIFYEVNCNIYMKRCFNNLDIELEFKEEAVFEGEDTEIIQSISNKKWIPLWWIRIQYDISSNIKYSDDKSLKGRKENSRIEEFGLLAYEKVVRKSSIKATKRGCYRPHDVQAISSDFFVKNTIIKKFNYEQQPLYVFPRQLNGINFEIKFNKLLGDVITRKQLIQDPFEVNGIRDYDQFDTMKDINWKATARSNEIKVNKYNYTASEEVVIFFTAVRENDWIEDETMEEAIRIISTINTELSDKGVFVSLITDCTNNNEKIIIPRGCGSEHNYIFNEALSKIDTTSAKYNLSEIIEKEYLKNEKDKLWIIVSNYTGDNLKNSILEAERNGYDTWWIIVEDKNIKALIEEENNIVKWEVK